MTTEGHGQNEWLRCKQSKVKLTMDSLCQNICISNVMLILFISVLHVQCTD